MRISRKSQLTGILHTMDLPVTQEQLDEYYYGDRSLMIQDIFPNLDAGQREFLMTGITPKEWDNLFPEEEEHEYINDEPAF